MFVTALNSVLGGFFAAWGFLVLWKVGRPPAIEDGCEYIEQASVGKRQRVAFHLGFGSVANNLMQ
jgi:hypothetical protein